MLNMINTPKMLNTVKVISVSLAFTVVSQLTFAVSTDEQAAQDKGMNIFVESKARDTGWEDFTADMLMTLRNEQGQKSEREVKMKSLEQLDDGDKSITMFNKPKDVRGTTFLSYSHPVGADDQWLYLPSLKRVKRISSRNKSGPFMGSEFSFEDLGSFEIEKYSYKYLEDEVIEGMDNYKVEQYPLDENSGYSKRIVWVDKQQYRIVKIEFYDRKKSLLKTLSYHDFKLYLDKYWRANTSTMVNHQNGKSTELKWDNYVFRTGLEEADFNRNALRRTR